MNEPRYKFYNVLITLYKNNAVCPNLFNLKAESAEVAIEYSIKDKRIIDLLLDGYVISAKTATEIAGVICPSNVDSVFVYCFDETDKIKNLYIDFNKCTPEFYKDLKDVLLKHWTKDTDKL